MSNMHVGKENRRSAGEMQVTGSSTNVLAEIQQKGNNTMHQRESPMSGNVCKAEGMAFAWHTERALQTQQHLSHELDTMDMKVVKREPQNSKNSPANFHLSMAKPGQLNIGQKLPPMSMGFGLMKVEPENNANTSGASASTNIYQQQATYPSRPGYVSTDYYQRHYWETIAMTQGHQPNTYGFPGQTQSNLRIPFSQPNWTISRPWQHPFPYHPSQGSFPYKAVNDLSVGPMGSNAVGRDQAEVRTSQMQESSRRGSHIDPLRFAVPLSVIQQPRRVGFGDTQKWTVVKQENTAGSSLQENITPFLKEHSGQENTTKPQKKTTPPLQKNITPTPQQKPVLSPQDEKFGCETCGKVYKVKSLFQSHLDDHRKGFTQVDNMLYRCDTCNREFATQTSVLYHMRIHNRLKCLDCSFVCSKKKVLAKHICPSKKTKTEKGSKKRKIDTQIQNVIKQEYNAGSNQENIPQPQESTPRKESVISSQQSKATLLPRDEKFACKTCGKEFKVKSLYQSHIQDHEKGFTHSDTTTYRCDTCDREFATPTAVMYHLRIHKMLRCPDCNFFCSKKKLLEKHVCKHKKVRAGHCQTCSATFPTRAQLNKHYAQHRDHLPVACPWQGCTLRFEHLSNLVQHQVVHTGESRYICEYCGQQFKHAQNLKVHIRIHTDEKPFKCDKCDYSGRQQHALDWHNRSHHGIPIPKRSKVNVDLSNHGSPISEGSKDSSDQDSSIPEGSKDNVNSSDPGGSISEGSKDNVNSSDQDSPIFEGSKDNVNINDQDGAISELSKDNSSISEGSKTNVNSSDHGSPVPERSNVNVNICELGSTLPVKVKGDTAAD